MAATTSAPTGAAATDASERMPDCIIASSHRFHDLLPFCNSLYYTEPQKWGCILPWEFPQSATKKVEEEFLRKYFSETEIHMQGGAQGEGAGFRFLKQAWYSIALWNYEHRIPAIATWWLESEENSSILEDPTMRDTLCNEEVKPETFFNSRDIQMYGTPLLACVVKQIQYRVKTKQTPPVEEAQIADKPRSASDSNMALGPTKTESVPVAPPPVGSNDRAIRESSYKKPPRAASTIVSANEVATPFPVYEDNSRSMQNFRHNDHQHSAWSAGYPNHQVQGRKRGGRLSNAGGGTRGASYDRPAQDYQHRFNPSMLPPNSALPDGSASFGVAAPGPAIYPNQVTPTYPNIGPPIPGVLQAPAFDTFGSRTPVQHARRPNFPSGEHHAQSSATLGMFVGGSTNRGHLAHRSDMERLPSEMSANSGFNNISVMSGDVRRSSFSSRGAGGLRGSNQLRGGKRGGGRGRDFSQQSPSVFEEGPYARKVSHEHYQKSNPNYSKRRGSAYQENTWRSGSEHPQVENTLPQRVLFGPNEYPGYQGFPGVAGSHLLPPFTFPQNQAGERQNQPGHRQAPARLDRHQHLVPDYDVDERFIGSHATHVNELVVFNIPILLTEDEVARDFSRTCDVEVVRVHFGKDVNGPEDVAKLAFVQLPDHNVARRVLDLREVYLYEKPLAVLVPRKWHSQPSMPLMPAQHVHQLNASGGSFVPSGQFHPDSYGYPRDSAPPPQFGLASMVTNSQTHPSGIPRPGFVSVPPSTPYSAVKGEPGLSAVLSSNATPANSEPNTPRKKKNKKKKAVPPPATIIEHDSGAPMDSTNTATPNATPSKIKYKKESPQDRAASNNLVVAEETTSSKTVPAAEELKVANGGETTKDSQEPSDLSVRTSKITAEAKHSGGSSHIDEHKSETTPTVSLRSQAPKDFSNQADVALDSKQSQFVATDNEPDTQHLSSPVSEKDRPAIVDRVSDSDHVDESFHTASASPLTDKQSQTKAVPTNGATSPNTVRTKKSTRLSDKRSASSQVKKIANETDEHVQDADVEKAMRHDSTSVLEVSPTKTNSVDPQGTPTTPLPISIEAPTPPKKKSTKTLSDNKPPRSASNRSVSESSSTQQTPFSVEASKSHDGPAQRAKSLSLGENVSLAENEKGAEADRPQTLGAQDAASATSIPPTPMTAYHTAPTTPAPLETSASKEAVEKSSSQAKTPVKKGPSQTESFSMFGKKQQKQKKTGKGKGTLRVKPPELVNASNLSSGNTSQSMSSTATSRPAGASTSNKKPALTVKTETGSSAPNMNTNPSKPDSTSGEIVCSEEAVTATSGQESPSKGGLRNLLGGFFSRVKSPIGSGQKPSLEDISTEDGLMESKAPAAISQAQTMFNLDHLVQQRTFDDERSHGDKSVFTTDINTDFNDANDPDISGMSVTGLGILASSSTDLKETPKKSGKKKNNNNKSPQRDKNQREGSPEANEDEDKSESISAQTDAASGSFDLQSDNGSDKSSTTMGRHTPPVSPAAMTPSTRRRFEQRMNEEHILSPRAPLNKNKKKPHSRATSSATASSAQETPATTTTGPSAIERGQQKRVRQVFRMSGSDDSGDSQDTATPPVQYILSNILDDEGNTQQVLLTLKRIIRLSNNGGRLNLYGLDNGSDDDVALAVAGMDTVKDDEAKDRDD